MSDDFSGLPPDEPRGPRRPIRWGIVAWGVLLAIVLVYVGVSTVVEGVTTYDTSHAQLGSWLTASAPAAVALAFVAAVVRR